MLRMDRSLRRIVETALVEDGARRDATTRSVLGGYRRKRVLASVVAKERFLLCGVPLARYAFRLLDEKAKLKVFHRDGEWVSGGVLFEVQGTVKAVLGAERVALNLLQLASAVATKTARFVEAVRGTNAEIFDTRKTLPGLRALQRYAVRIGGGKNHRFNLSDAALVKDNHWRLLTREVSAPEGIYEEAVKALRKAKAMRKAEVEVETVAEMEAAVEAGFRLVMLDNFTIDELREAVAVARRLASRLKRRVVLEASGGVTLKNVRAIAETGVDRISVGELTHTIEPPDVSLEVVDYI